MMTSNQGTLLALATAYASVAMTVLCAAAAAGFRETVDSYGDASASEASGLEDGYEEWNEEIVNATIMFMTNQSQTVTKELRSATCYDGVGCFNTTDHMRLKIGGPQSPEKVGTRFIFYSTTTPEGKEVKIETWDSIYAKQYWDLRKRLVGVVHGFTESGSRKWVLQMKDALLNIDANVMVVDWKNGAARPTYPMAAKNSPMPGVMPSLLLQKIIQSSKHALKQQNVHVVGFSLGAQAAGFCGRHFLKTTKTRIGRITGLDPAGPLFDRSQACLSKKDADLVDVIHTNAGKLINFRYGLKKAVGHVDFWPNGGFDQPGCLSITTGPLRCLRSR